MENSNNVFMFYLELFFYVKFHSKLLLRHFLRTFVVFVLKLVHTIMLEKKFVKQIDNIMLFVGMSSPI